MLELLNKFLNSDPKLKSALKFLDNAESLNVSIKEDGNAVNIITNKDLNDEEYKEFVDGVLATYETVAKLVGDDKFVISIQCGSRQIDTYIYKDNEFVLAEPKKDIKKVVKYVTPKTEVKENKVVLNLDKDKANIDKVIDNFKESDTKCIINDKTAPLSFAQNLKNRIVKEIEENNDLFDVDFAIEMMNDIFDEGAYDPIYDDKGEMVAIDVPVEYLVEDFDGLSDDAKQILEGDGKRVFDFVNRCISELGFSNVIPSYLKEDDNSDYTSINFRFVF